VAWAWLRRSGPAGDTELTRERSVLCLLCCRLASEREGRKRRGTPSEQGEPSGPSPSHVGARERRSRRVVASTHQRRTGTGASGTGEKALCLAFGARDGIDDKGYPSASCLG